MGRGSRGGGGVTTLLALGFGYAAQHYAALYGARFDRIIGTTRSAANAAKPAARSFSGRSVEMIIYEGVTADAAPPPGDCALAAAIADASAILVSIAPDGGGDPVLARWHDAIAAAPRLATIVYLSTIAVYGNHDGAWIDEATPLAPALTRAADRIEAERAWQALGALRGVPVAVIRIAGIYGPGANSLVAVRAGRARRIVKPGQVFNRIHVADLAQIIDKAFERRADGVFNAADDEPTPPGDPIAYAAQLLGVAPPPEIPFEEAKATMAPFAVSFYGESKRVRNERIKTMLGVGLRYPTYREGLQALADGGETKE
jgi:nucleoside-diphosphate-sugar epimerase